jgi:hypothetical protein
VQGCPAQAAATAVKDPYTASQREEAEFERILKERGVKLPELTIPKVVLPTNVTLNVAQKHLMSEQGHCMRNAPLQCMCPAKRGNG